ncbi:hypothetical protein ACTMSW_05855 [Micromonospora sp. BQ11]|uniref:hypothetical protein n=1 Tax=Micromonospora sp. BQ11 TaxID=3452212 RepID=UPI003F8B00AC
MVLDHSALLALGAGNRALSALVVEAHRGAGRHVHVPALCLAAASSSRPALGDHVGALPALEVVDLTLASALVVGRLVRQGMDWQYAHAAVLGRPDAEWPQGRVVLTETPKAYAGTGVVTMRVT